MVGSLYHSQYHRTKGYVYQEIGDSTFCTETVHQVRRNPIKSFLAISSYTLPYTFCEQTGKEIRDISDEIPFDVPESWEWCRLGDILLKLTDGTHSTPKYTESGIPFISVKDVSSGRLDFSKCKHISEKEHSELYERCNPEYGDILLTKVGTTGIPVVVDTNEQFSLFVSVALLKFNQELLYNKYLICMINSPLVQIQATENTKGVGNKNWVMRDISNTLIVIPPLSEQHRIVSKIEELLPYIERYGKAEEHLSALNTTFLEALKKSILQEAVQGKLVPQNPGDEPASVLLERIRAEKKRLVKEGKIKKDKHESVIVTRDKIPYEIIDGNERCIADEVPFELPEGWCWCKMGICLDVRDGTHDTPKYVTNGIPLVTSKNLCNGIIDFSTAKFISLEDHEAISQRSKVDTDDIMFAMIGSIGNPVLYHGNEVFSIKNMALFKKIENGMDMEYVYWFLYISQGDMKRYASGGVQSFVSLSYLRNYYIPIPPIAEQRRIVEKIKELMQYCNKL